MQHTRFLYIQCSRYLLALLCSECGDDTKGVYKDRGHKQPTGPLTRFSPNSHLIFSKSKYHGGQRLQSLGNIDCANLIEVRFDLVDFPLIR